MMNGKNKKPFEGEKVIKGQVEKNIKTEQFKNNTSDLNYKSEISEDTISLTFFEGSVYNTTPDSSDPISWNFFSEILSEPEKGSKDGSYFVRAKCTGERNDKNMSSASPILIIDADKGMNDTAGPPPDYVAETLHEMNYQFIMYTSFSHTPEKPKYRIIFLLDRMVKKSELKFLYHGVINILSENGIGIQGNSESTTWSQPWFLPRYQTKAQREYFFHSDGGIKKLSVDVILSRRSEKKISTQGQMTQDQLLKLKKNTPPCISFYISDTKLKTTPYRNFNLIKMTLVAYGLSTGKDKTETVAMCREFIDHYPHSYTLKTAESRLSNFENCYDSMKQNGKKFSCRTVKALKAPKNAFDCKKCSLKQPNIVEDVLVWVDETKDNKEIQVNWIQKTKGMDAVSTDKVIRAVSQRTEIGIRPLNNDLKNQQIQWQKEKRKLARKKKAAKRKAEGKTEIIFEKIATGKAVSEMSKALAKYKGTDCVYRYGSSLVSVVQMRPSSVRMVKRIHDKHDKNQNYPDIPIIHTHTTETLKHELEKVACCIEKDEQDFEKDIMWPKFLIKGLMETAESLEKPLTGIVEHPYIDESFNPVTDQGYDAKTGLIKIIDFEYNFNFNDKIDKEQAKMAYKYLCDEVFADFPFDTELDKAGAVSALLTALQRKIITGDSGCPGYLFDAPTQATGKTTLAQIISYSIYGRPVAATSWSNDDNEMGKHILAILREGHSCVLFDNLPNGTILKSDELAKAMTSGTYSKRLLGENTTVTVPSCVLWLFTGNNISVVEDFNTRILLIRLDAKITDLDTRTFKRSDIKKWCKENRSWIIDACLTIILAAKEAQFDLPPTRYNEWDRFVHNPVYYASGIDIAGLFERNKASDPKIEGQKQLLEIWYKVFGNIPKTAKDIVQKAQRESGLSYEYSTGLSDVLQDIFGGTLPTSSRFGRWLGGIKDRIIGGYKLTATKGSDRNTHNVMLWRVEKVDHEEGEPD